MTAHRRGMECIIATKHAHAVVQSDFVENARLSCLHAGVESWGGHGVELPLYHQHPILQLCHGSHSPGKV